jgi:hypothetical protein
MNKLQVYANQKGNVLLISLINQIIMILINKDWKVQVKL